MSLLRKGPSNMAMFFIVGPINRARTIFHCFPIRWVVGPVASWLVGSTPDRDLAGDIAVFMGKTLNFHSVSLHPGV